MKIKSTDYAEKWARQMLNQELDFELSTLVHKDKPDLQDFAHQIGIEVTQDVYEKEMHACDFGENMKKYLMIKSPKKILNYITKTMEN